VAERRAPLTLAGTEVRAGRTVDVDVPLSRLPTGTSVSMPVRVLHGLQPGPVVWLSAALHGDELNGIEIIRRVLSQLRPKELRGTVIAVPIVNVYGFLLQSRYLPDRRDLNRSFPGSPRGSLAARLAHTFFQEIVSRCSHGIDLHTGSHQRTNLAQIRADLDDAETRALALAFGAPAVIHSRLRDGSLREAAAELGTKVLLFEGGEAGRFDPAAIRCGVRGVKRVLNELGLSSGAPESQDPPVAELAESSWVRAGHGGILRLDVELGDQVREGDTLGAIADSLGAHSRTVLARRPGLVIGHTTNPLVNRGDALVHVGHTREAHTGSHR
jgi:predicted deacylase